MRFLNLWQMTETKNSLLKRQKEGKRNKGGG